jgi:hypothetical protein
MSDARSLHVGDDGRSKWCRPEPAHIRSTEDDLPGEETLMTIRCNNGLVISKMTGKMEGFYALNTSPLNNEFCEKMASNPGTVCANCYSRRMCVSIRRNANLVWMTNGAILSESVIPDSDLPNVDWFSRNGAFRFSAHGELINDTHLVNLINIAKKSPKTVCTLWTKRAALVQKHLDDIPDNMILVYSTPKMDPVATYLPEGFDKVFSVYTTGGVERMNVDINCSGKCKTCMLCYRRDNSIVFINEHVK